MVEKITFLVVLCWWGAQLSSAFSCRHTTFTCRPPPLFRNPSRVFMSNDKRQSISELDLLRMEDEVEASALATLDRRRIQQALMYDNGDDGTNRPTNRQPSSSPLQIAIAAGLVTFAGSFLSVHNWIISTVTFTVVFVLAWRDPIDDNDDDQLWGAVARLLGRSTLQAVETTAPKVKAVARAALTEQEELVELKNQLQELQYEIDELRLWKQRRLAVDDTVSDYSLEELKQRARASGLPVGGKKQDLLMRLVEAGVVVMPDNGGKKK